MKKVRSLRKGTKVKTFDTLPQSKTNDAEKSRNPFADIYFRKP